MEAKVPRPVLVPLDHASAGTKVRNSEEGSGDEAQKLERVELRICQEEKHGVFGQVPGEHQRYQGSADGVGPLGP